MNDDTYDHDDCLLRAALAAKDAEACKRISSDLAKSACITGVARNTSNFALCESVGNPDSRNRCIASAVSVPEDEARCRQMPQPHDGFCYSNLASTTYQTKFCGKIKTQVQGFVGMCYGTVGFRSGDRAVCRQIGNTDARDMCWDTLAVNLLDASLCEDIADSALQGRCRLEAAAQRIS